MNITGRVISGRGLAATQFADDSEALTELLGAPPYIGTLNLLVDELVLFRRETAATPTKGGRHMFWPAEMFGRRCLVMRWPYCPFHVVEIVSDVHLRSAFQLTAGSRIELKCDDMLPVPFPNRIAWLAIWAGRRELAYTSDAYYYLLLRFARSLLRSASQ